MLIGAWKESVRYEEIDRYHWINATGLLSVKTIQAAARDVWPFISLRRNNLTLNLKYVRHHINWDIRAD